MIAATKMHTGRVEGGRKGTKYNPHPPWKTFQKIVVKNQ
jgi:hypothetical protein